MVAYDHDAHAARSHTCVHTHDSLSSLRQLTSTLQRLQNMNKLNPQVLEDFIQELENCPIDPAIGTLKRIRSVACATYDRRTRELNPENTIAIELDPPNKIPCVLLARLCMRAFGLREYTWKHLSNEHGTPLHPSQSASIVIIDL